MSTPPGTAAKRLSRRELEVAALVAEGLTNREIGQRLFISERTVDGHLEHIRDKLDVNTRAQVAAWVVRRGSGSAPPASAVARSAVQGPVLVAHPRLWIAAALLVAILAAAVGLLQLTAAPEPTIDTIAGKEPRVEGSVGGYAGDTGLAVDARLSRPSDVVAAKDGTIYIADYGNGVIRRIDPRRVITTVAGGGGAPLTDGAFARDVELQAPSNLALDPTGALDFLEIRDGHLEVWKIKDLDAYLVADLGESRAASPVQPKLPVGGLVIAPDGTMFIADSAENHVWKVTSGGVRSIYAGRGVAGFGGDLGAATDAQLFDPIGLALDGQGGLYIADVGNNRIRKVDAQGIITTVAGSLDYPADAGDGGRATAAKLSDPFAIAIGRDGSIYIADTGNNRVRRITTSGQIVAVAGNGQPGFWGDAGPALQAQLEAPEAISFDWAGRLLIADTGNHRIREVTGLPG